MGWSMLLNLFNFFRGYITVCVTGYMPERFINICSRRNIFLWDVKFTEKNVLYANIDIKDFKRVRGAVYKSKSNLRVKAKRGLPFFLHKYKKRQALVLGIIFFAALIFYMSSIVWDVRIIGVNNTNIADVQKILKEDGVVQWTFTRSLDTDKTKFDLVQNLGTLSWANVSIKGSTVIVEVRERKPKPAIIPDNIPCNLVAKNDGVITLMLVKEGENLVNVGDTVYKGQLLVSAIKGVGIPNPMKVHSFGEIIAKTWYEKSLDRKLYNEKKEYTGNEYLRRSLNIFGFNINLYKNTGNLYTEYDTINTAHNYFIFTVNTQTFKEVNFVKEELTAEQATDAAIAELMQQLAGESDEDLKIISQTADHIFIDSETIHVKCTFECSENIAVQEEVK